MNERLNLVGRGWIWIQGRKNSKCGRIAVARGRPGGSSSLCSWVDQGWGGRWPVNSGTGFGGREDLHEGVGHDRRQAAAEAPFFLASYCPGMVKATPIKY